MVYTQKPIWEQINLKALYSPIHFYIAAGDHDWKTHYPYILLKATRLSAVGKQTRKHTKSFMIDSLGMDITPLQLVQLQKKYNVDIFISKDEFQDKDRTTELTINYLKALIKEKIFNKEIMVILQGINPDEYKDHFDEILVITANAEKCINCKHNSLCDVIFWQITRLSAVEYCEKHYEKSKKNRKWLFRFAIGGLIKRSIEEQVEIIDTVLNYAIDSSAFTFKDLYPKRIRTIMTNTTTGTTRSFEYDPIQFHLFGIGASRQIFPVIMRNQPFILSFDSQTPSKIATFGLFFDKELGRFPSVKELAEDNKYTFRQKIDDVGDVSALNTLRGFYNTAMILYAMESQMKLAKENQEINMLKRYIKFPSPKLSNLRQTELKDFLERNVKKVLANLLSYKAKIDAGMTEEEIVEEALLRWTQNYEKTGIMTVSLALLNGLIIFKTLSIKQIIANIPTIRSPQAAMNVITINYKIMEYPICEDTPKYKQKLVPKTIQIRKKHLDLVLKYLLKDPKLKDEYKQVRGFE